MTEYGTVVGVHVVSTDTVDGVTALIHTTKGTLRTEPLSLASTTAHTYVNGVYAAELSERGRVYRLRVVR